MRSALVIFASICGSLSFPLLAAPVSLPGQDTRILPYVAVPFLKSKLTIVQGVKNSDGVCEYPVEVNVTPGMLLPRQKYLQVRRAHNPVTCQELLEEGVVGEGFEIEPSASEGVPVHSSSVGASSARSPSLLLAADDGTWQGTATVKWTDGNNPYVRPLRPVFDGITVSSITSNLIHTVSGSCSGEYTATGRGTPTDFYNVVTGWSEVYGYQSLVTTCNGSTHDIHAQHQNSTDGAVLFDCSQGGVRITYSPLRFGVDRFGGKQLSGNISAAGDSTDCGEYLVRFNAVQ